MSSAVSLEYLQSIEGAVGGLATLDSTGKIPVGQMPAGSVETYKGVYATTALLIAAHPTGAIADYAYDTATLSFWYWNALLAVPAWVNQMITEDAYQLLTAPQKAAVPYIIIHS